ncbi:MAG: hypothetical protein M1814_004543 [Vezdaea aestivalis]|nr:MAG: hypothetical protein M1814_004543 [Vezdaea aestivalis]
MAVNLAAGDAAPAFPGPGLAGDPTLHNSTVEGSPGASPDPQLTAALSDQTDHHDIPENPILVDKTRTHSFVNDEDDLSRLSTTATRESAVPQKAFEKKEWYKRLNPLRWANPPLVPKERVVSREYGASFLSILTFQWMDPLMTTGYRRPLEVNDIWLVNPDRNAEVLTGKLNASFRLRNDRGEKYPLLWAIYDTFKKELWIGGLCRLSADIFQVMNPFILRYLIQFATNAYISSRSDGRVPPPHIGKGIGLAIGVTLMQMLQSLGTNHFIYRGMMVGAQSRAALISILFEKSMRISGRAKAGGKAIEDHSEIKEGQGPGAKTGKDLKPGISGDGVGWGNGRIVNLMSTDTYRIDQASGLFHLIWTSPISILLTLVLLIINLTYSALAGFGLLVIGGPIVTMAVKSLFLRRRAINKITDKRVSLTQEILHSVRFVKFFGWEKSFLDRLGDVRRTEIRAIQWLLAIRNAVNAVSLTLPIFASMLAFITYSLSHHALTPAPIFSSLALFNALRLPLLLLPTVISQAVDGWSSIRRIQDFLVAEEMQEDVKWASDGDKAIKVKDGCFTWERTPNQAQETGKRSAKKSRTSKEDPKKPEVSTEKPRISPSKEVAETESDSSSILDEKEPFKLVNLNITVGRNELLAVVGGVGSGKSSLLAALAGDMRKTDGEVTIGASRAFCPQYAWIQNATLKENILFGKDLDRRWYNKVIEACALQPDLDMLPNADDTEIGERGITVSGGQKQRLNIARAIYFDAEIVLMDDPLSAVDAHVGRHIFDYAITGLLKDKCRILATHQLHVLNRCDRILWMEDGRIIAHGTFTDLMANNTAFAKMMLSTAQEETDKAEDKSGEEKGEEGDKKHKKHGKRGVLMQVEERAVKSVPWSVYKAYIEASGSLLNGPLILIGLIVTQGANITTNLWLSYWTSNKFNLSTGQYIGIYAGLGAAQVVCMFIFSVSLTIFGTQASKVMMARAIKRVLRAPMSFFDTTPLGRITNRFSRDVETMDNQLTEAMRMYFFTMAMIISVFVLIIAFFHYFAIALVPLFFMFIFSASYYRASAREMKRHESVLRSTVYAKFSEALTGTASIRAYGLQNRFVSNLRESIDSMNSAYYLTFSNQRWLAVRLDVVGILLVFTTSILVVTSRFNVSPSIGGLVLSYILSIVSMLQFTVRQLAEVENAMNATERLQYYGTQLEGEAPATLPTALPPLWPSSGRIELKGASLRYRAGLPLVLQDVSLSIRAGERLAIVGRTGAGKSSILSALFRLVELDKGRITIDDVDIATVGLHDLRSRLAIIPQDPTLFRGTVRSNLDPFGEHTDLKLWDALRQSHLVSGAEEHGHDRSSPHVGSDAGRITLDAAVEEEGLNFSLGQRQLMALARALVRNSQIIVADEATSSVDMETDQRIQETMARGFKGKTVLCIAHRLRTILGYDRVVVLDKGKVIELGSPKELWDMEGVFRGMCERSGVREGDLGRGAIAA